MKILSRSQSLNFRDLNIGIQIGPEKQGTAWSVLLVHEYATSKNNRWYVDIMTKCGTYAVVGTYVPQDKTRVFQVLEKTRLG